MKVLVMLACLVAVTSQQGIQLSGLENAFGNLGSVFGAVGGVPSNSGTASPSINLGNSFGNLDNTFGNVFGNSATALSNSANSPPNTVNVPTVNPAVAAPNVQRPGNTIRPAASVNTPTLLGSTPGRPGNPGNLFGNAFNVRPGINGFGNAPDLFPNAANFFANTGRPFRGRPVLIVPANRNVVVPDLQADDQIWSPYLPVAYRNSWPAYNSYVGSYDDMY